MNGNAGFVDERLDDRDILLDVGDLAGVDLILGDAAGLGGMGGDERVEPLCNLASAACGHKNLAIVRVETVSQSSSGSSPKLKLLLAGRVFQIPKASSTGLSRSCELDWRQAAATSNTRRER